MIPTHQDLRAWGERLTRDKTPNNGKDIITYANAWRTEVEALHAENVRLRDKLAGLSAALASLVDGAREEIL